MKKMVMLVLGVFFLAFFWINPSTAKADETPNPGPTETQSASQTPSTAPSSAVTPSEAPTATETPSAVTTPSATVTSEAPKLSESDITPMPEESLTPLPTPGPKPDPVTSTSLWMWPQTTCVGVETLQSRIHYTTPYKLNKQHVWELDYTKTKEVIEYRTAVTEFGLPWQSVDPNNYCYVAPVATETPTVVAGPVVQKASATPVMSTNKLADTGVAEDLVIPLFLGMFCGSAGFILLRIAYRKWKRSKNNTPR
jgi:hypothetical protein